MPGNQQEFDDSSEAEGVMHNNFINPPRIVNPPRNLVEYVDLLSRPRERENNNIQNEIVTTLPAEILIKIFSYLDDLSLWTVSEVCVKWKKVLELNTPQAMWRRYTKERFPLFQQISTVTNWFQVSLIDLFEKLEINNNLSFRCTQH